MIWEQKELTALGKVLAELYPRDADQRRLVHDAGLKEAAIAFDAVALNSWSNILRYAKLQSRVDALVAIARDEYPDSPLFGGIAEGPKVADWRAPKNLERIIGEGSSLVPVSYLAAGLRCARSVAKIARADGTCGTGFLLPDDVLVTNHHVLESAEAARSAKLLFNYQDTIEGRSEQTEEVALEPGALFRTSPVEQDDWTLVRVAKGTSAKWGALDLSERAIDPGERVNIVQHPGGGPKQISFFSNVVVFAGAGRVQYLTDTLPGSSGAPVFDRAWKVVALHHSGGWLREPGRDPKQVHLRNEGIAASIVVAALRG
jgi:S1-C subfamily serine protease